MNIRLAMFKTVIAYVVTEHLEGEAKTLKVKFEDDFITISDDGRGHAIGKIINGIPYLEMVYCQLSLADSRPALTSFVYPALGMSLFAEMCEKINLTVAKHGKIHKFCISDGSVIKVSESESSDTITGNTIEYSVKEHVDSPIKESDIISTLQNIAVKFKNLNVYFNNQLLESA